jgi:Ca-activated chloride channel family protein
MRADSGATLLLSGNTKVTVETEGLTLQVGRLFVDTEGGPAVLLHTKIGVIETAEGRSSVTMSQDGSLNVYVLRGTARYGELRVSAGEQLSVTAKKETSIERAATWNDWTLGLGTADPEAQPAPFGIGTVGARAPSDQGKPRFPLVIQRLEVRVVIDQDFATTEVDETFLNPSESTVEGLYGFRVPKNAVLDRFGVDRDGHLVWGHIKEKFQAKEQYDSNVYAGSREDPALLEWVQRGVYQARLYPIDAGTTRRLVTRYSEWLGRHGEQGERRLYVYPMAASGAEGTLPRIEEMTFRLDYSKANATRIRAPRGAVQRDQEIILKSHDFTPKSDVFLELYDSGRNDLIAYRAPHVLGPNDTTQTGDTQDGDTGARGKEEPAETDYLLLPLPTAKNPEVEGGIDLSIVVDSSAATDPRSLSLGRHLVAALLNALGPKDRVALFAGDTLLRPVLNESDHLSAIDEAKRETYLAALSNVPLGGATDLGILLASAAERLDVKRRGAVIYIGDGRPSVGEMLSKPLRERLERLPPTTRILAAGTGPNVNAPLLESLVRGGPLELIGNNYEAARAALHLLEAANSNNWQGSQVELAGLDRLLPKYVPAVASDEPALIVGRVTGPLGKSVTLTLGGKTQQFSLRVLPLKDEGDLRRRWGEGRLQELTEQQSGRLALVDLARRYGLLTPYTSLYVATRAETEAAEPKQSIVDDYASQSSRRARWQPWSIFSNPLLRKSEESNPVANAAVNSDNKEGGTGTRAKGEEGSMGNVRSAQSAKAGFVRNHKASVRDSLDSSENERSRAALLEEAQQFGMTGLLQDKGASKTATAETPARGSGVVGLSKASAPIQTTAKRATKSARNRLTAPSPYDPLAEALNGTSAGFGADSPQVAAPVPQVAAPVPNKTPPQPSTPESREQHSAKPLVVDTHHVIPCSAASRLPLAERRKLWTERLFTASNPDAVLRVYEAAIAQCEAANFGERQVLLYSMVDRLSQIADRVTLYRKLLARPSAAAVVYQAILARVKDAEGTKQLHVALGIKQIDETLLKNLLEQKKSLVEQIVTLRELVQKWPEDLELGLQLLYALEDGNEPSAARAYAQKLRKRSDSTTHIRTAVGEFYLRQSVTNPDGKIRDEAEARRCFGEIVEFAPEDPVARRILGDLMVTHGWYDEAFRQYQTLSLLLPEDPTVELRLAEAAYGMGKTEEALRWTEKARATASPDGQTDLDRGALAWAATYLAWAYEEARKADKRDVLARLLLRSQRLGTGEIDRGTKYILTWAHPELRPSLFLITREGEQPARTMALLRVAEETNKDVIALEIRIDPEDAAKVARFDAKLRLTAITNEGTEQQQISTQLLSFNVKHTKPDRLRVSVKDGTFSAEVL